MHLIKSSFKNLCIQIIFPVDVKIIKQLSSFLVPTALDLRKRDHAVLVGLNAACQETVTYIKQDIHIYIFIYMYMFGGSGKIM